jgi:hypothetical protein
MPVHAVQLLMSWLLLLFCCMVLLACRLMVSFNTTSGMPSPFATFGNAAARRATPITDVKTNVAEAGTMSMEFTTIGRLLGATIDVTIKCHG